MPHTKAGSEGIKNHQNAGMKRCRFFETARVQYLIERILDARLDF